MGVTLCSLAVGIQGVAEVTTVLGKSYVNGLSKGVDAFANLARFDNLVVDAAGNFASNGKPLLDLRGLTNAQKGFFGEWLGKISQDFLQDFLGRKNHKIL